MFQKALVALALLVCAGTAAANTSWSQTFSVTPSAPFDTLTVDLWAGELADPGLSGMDPSWSIAYYAPPWYAEASSESPTGTLTFAVHFDGTVSYTTIDIALWLGGVALDPEDPYGWPDYAQAAGTASATTWDGQDWEIWDPWYIPCSGDEDRPAGLEVLGQPTIIPEPLSLVAGFFALGMVGTYLRKRRAA